MRTRANRQGGERSGIASAIESAWGLLRRGDTAGAAGVFRGVLAESRHHPGALKGLAEVAFREQRIEEAVRLLRQAIGRAPMRADLHVDLGRSLQVMGRDAEALASYRRGAALDRASPDAWCGIGDVHERRGEFEHARTAYGEALAIEGDHAVARLGMAKVLSRQGEHGEAAALCRAVMESSSGLVRATARLMHGRALDQMGEYERGFDEVRAGKEEMLELAGDVELIREGASEMRAKERSQFDYATEEVIARWRDRPVRQDRASAFLVGFPRSGTTLIEQILGSHMGVVTTDETSLLFEVETRAFSLPATGSSPVQKLDLSPNGAGEEIQRWYFSRAEEVVGERIGERMLVDKMPLNLVRAPVISYLFPSSRIIVVHRDPRDVLVSAFLRLGEGRLEQTIDFMRMEWLVARYEHVMGLWLGFRGRCPLPVLEVRYEDLVTRARDESGRLLEFLGLEWDEGVMTFHERLRRRYIKAPTYENVAQPIHGRSLSRWRRYASRLSGSFFERLRPFVRELGYEE